MMKGGMEVSDIKQLGHWQSNCVNDYKHDN